VSSTVRHPIFARWYQFVAAGAEKRGVAQHRRELLSGLSGRVIEVGAGHGLNFGHYPPSVTEVVAVEPEAVLRRAAEEAAKTASVPVQVVDGVADALPVESESFDAAVASLVLCSVPHQKAALSEIHRVIRPGGELRFYEHVISERSRLARVQRAADPIWTRLAGGCHLTRDTSAAIEAAGFELEDPRRFDFSVALVERLAAPHILGRARRV
jgi:ubiquinone/menaquinone biosynthesis C-methylase UbiE